MHNINKSYYIITFSFSCLAVVAAHYKLFDAANIKWLQRLPRQIVQPEWLTNMDNIDTAFKDVKITAENLQETAAIRESIQKAINEGQYAVTTFQSLSVPVRERSDVIPIQRIPQPSIPQRVWFNWPSTSTLPIIEFSWPKREQMQRMWLTMLENIRKWFGWI